MVKHSVDYHLGQLLPEVEDADLKLEMCKWCPELEATNPCNCTGNNWEEETEEEELEEIFCGKICDLTDDDFKTEEGKDLAKCPDCPYPAGRERFTYLNRFGFFSLFVFCLTSFFCFCLFFSLFLF